MGETQETPIDCRVIAATNKDLFDEVKKGNFREDLYYRLNVIPIELPPLRQRTGDIELLLEHFATRYSREQGRPFEGFSAQALSILLAHDYPGNVRELQNVVQRAVTLTRQGPVEPHVLPSQLHEETILQTAESVLIPEEGIDLEAVVEQFERTLINRALERTGGVKKDAAKLLGITYRAMRHRLSKYGMD